MNKEFAVAQVKSKLIKLSNLAQSSDREQWEIDRAHGEILGYIECLSHTQIITTCERFNLADLALFTAYPLPGMTYGGAKS